MMSLSGYGQMLFVEELTISINFYSTAHDYNCGFKIYFSIYFLFFRLLCFALVTTAFYLLFYTVASL